MSSSMGWIELTSGRREAYVRRYTDFLPSQVLFLLLLLPAPAIPL
jgi:hypothetical protein